METPDKACSNILMPGYCIDNQLKTQVCPCAARESAYCLTSPGPGQKSKNLTKLFNRSSRYSDAAPQHTGLDSRRQSVT